VREFTEAEGREHDRHYQEGWKLIRGDILLAGSRASGAPGWFARRRLAKAIVCFEAALAIHPDGWQSLWALGKIHQRLGTADLALQCFARAHALNTRASRRGTGSRHRGGRAPAATHAPGRAALTALRDPQRRSAWPTAC